MNLLLLGRAKPDGSSLGLPDDLSLSEWKDIGTSLGRAERCLNWFIGEWWAFGEHRYGDRKATAEDWEGPSFSTCQWAASVVRTFGRPKVSEAAPLGDDAARKTPARRNGLSFQHHAEVAALPAEAADAVLDKAEACGWSTRDVRTEVHKLKNAAAVGAEAPSDDTCSTDDLHALVGTGKKFGCIYADPPWLYDNQGTRAATGNHYGGMTVDELCALPIRELAADDAHLHLWTTNASSNAPASSRLGASSSAASSRGASRRWGLATIGGTATNCC
jgi:hypothetical protein